jgi:hypothetical protein
LNLIVAFLFGKVLTDMETCYKVISRQALSALRLRSDRFNIEPEITAHLLLRGFKILEVPISYIPRDYKEGKKINWLDGFEAFTTLVKCRLAGRAHGSRS